jgi:YIF1
MLPRRLHYNTQFPPTHRTFRIRPRPPHLPKDTCVLQAHRPIRREARRTQRYTPLRMPPHTCLKRSTSHSLVRRPSRITANSSRPTKTTRCRTIRRGVSMAQLRSLGCSLARARWLLAKTMFRKMSVRAVLCWWYADRLTSVTQFGGHIPVPLLKHHFNVSNSYVLHKLRLVLFPWRHRPWTRKIRRSEVNGQTEGWQPPREDINSPDLYIPSPSLN